MKFYIWNGQYVGNGMMWWREGSAGYTGNLAEAGRYSQSDAESICKSNHKQTAFPCDVVDASQVIMVVDSQYLDRDKGFTFESEWPVEREGVGEIRSCLQCGGEDIEFKVFSNGLFPFEVAQGGGVCLDCGHIAKTDVDDELEGLALELGLMENWNARNDLEDEIADAETQSHNIQARLLALKKVRSDRALGMRTGLQQSKTA